MPLPFILPLGTVSVLGAGVSLTQMFSKNENEFIKFGIIDQLHGQRGKFNTGNSVMFDIRDSTPIFYSDQEYYLLPVDKVMGTEQPSL